MWWGEVRVGLKEGLVLLVGVEIGDPSLLEMRPSRDQELTWAKVLKALTAVLRPPQGTNSLALRTAVRLTQARRRRRKFPQIRAGWCEGGHSRALLKGVAQRCGSLKRRVPLPRSLLAGFPDPRAQSQFILVGGRERGRGGT